MTSISDQDSQNSSLLIETVYAMADIPQPTGTMHFIVARWPPKLRSLRPVAATRMVGLPDAGTGDALPSSHRSSDTL